MLLVLVAEEAFHFDPLEPLSDVYKMQRSQGSGLFIPSPQSISVYHALWGKSLVMDVDNVFLFKWTKDTQVRCWSRLR